MHCNSIQRGLCGLNPLTGNQPAIETLKRADLVIDLVLLFSREQLDIQTAGTRPNAPRSRRFGSARASNAMVRYW
jgi:hypothetical protein